MASFQLYLVTFQVKSPFTPASPVVRPNATWDPSGKGTFTGTLYLSRDLPIPGPFGNKADVYGQLYAADNLRRSPRTAIVSPASGHPKDILAVLLNGHVTLLTDNSQSTNGGQAGVGEAIDVLSVAPFDRPVLTSGGAPALLFDVQYQIYKANSGPGAVFQYRRPPVKVVVGAASPHPADLQVPLNANVSLASGENYEILSASPIVQGTEGPSVWS